MTVSAVSVLFSPNLSGLQAAIAAALLAGQQPLGSFRETREGYAITMITGSALETPQTAYAVNGALAVTASGTDFLTKAGVGAYTLAAPSRDGIRKRIVNTTANAHVVTATTLIQDGVTGGAKSTLTFGAFAGASIELESYGGFWYVAPGKNVVTVA